MGGRTDKALFATLLAGLAAALRAELTEPQLEVMWLALRDLTRGELETAVRRAVMECTFFPSVAEMIKLAGRTQRRYPHGRMRMINGKPHVFLEGSGWMEFHGPLSWFDEPGAIGDGMGELLRLEAPKGPPPPPPPPPEGER